MKSRWPRAIPVVVSLAVFIILMVALFAGRNHIAEDYDIITVNISDLYTHNSTKPTARSMTPVELPNRPCEGDSRIPRSEACSTMTTHDKRGDNNDKATIITPATSSRQPQVDDHPYPEFFSLYSLSICEGVYSPDKHRAIRQCYSVFSGNTSTIPSLLPSNTTISSSLSSAMAGLTRMLRATGVFLALSTGLVGVSCFLGMAFFIGGDSDALIDVPSVWLNLVCSGLAVFCAVLAGTVGAAGGKVAEGKIKEFGVPAEAGRAWVVLVWSAVPTMMIVLGWWVYKVVDIRRKRRWETERERVIRGGRQQEGGYQLPEFGRMPRRGDV
ncbi:hypothetical protein C8A05DRAFT_37590 [Staphylotrichum tortipilum]|uniref:Uncharacterized protein n=1 Tax=Staphylotrichum tortipilum TaxID=2831512 RepID=A0AAN6MDH6_9PEZI|nr:hypothetical protein C8A05DRAFT_37590 [Staphylotrichum longicolle]